MKINRITIQNFRNVSDVPKDFGFNPNFTVIIGINGKGKSTILHALRVACGAYFLGIPDVKYKGGIKNDEIRLESIGRQIIPKKPVLVEAEGKFDIGPSIIWRRRILATSNSNTSSDSDVGKIRAIGKHNYDSTISNKDNITLPVIAFFGTSRAHGAGRNREARVGRQIFKEGYQDWSEMKSSTFKYENWLAYYNVLVANKQEYSKTKDAFFDAVKTANRYITDMKEAVGALSVKVKIDDFESDYLPLDFHSDGIRFFTDMVAELAYRCIMLNGHLKERAVLETSGVVMIDELDLNLHPTWQKVVVEDLKKAFPKIQFIVTTHSPFIVQSLNSDELINLDLYTDVSPKDLSLEVVAEDIMNVKSPFSSDNVETEKVSLDYFELLKEADESQNKANYIGQLEAYENAISDSGLRAFLKTARIAKNII
jgi:predicted ATP-binding protein involved in virulence